MYCNINNYYMYIGLLILTQYSSMHISDNSGCNVVDLPSNEEGVKRGYHPTGVSKPN